jgi:hypothetical protein
MRKLQSPWQPIMRHNPIAQRAHGHNDTNEQGVRVMASRNDFADKFRQLLKGVPDDYTLEQWQHTYRQTIFLMGMQILERFEDEAIAQQTRHERMRFAGIESAASPDVAPGGVTINFNASHGGGAGGGGNPSFLARCDCRVFPDYPLALQAVEIKGRDRSRR